MTLPAPGIRTPFSAGFAILFVAASAGAQDINTSGHAAYIPQDQVETHLPDGTIQASVRMGGYLVTDDPDDPSNYASQDCASTNMLSATGELEMTSGHCATRAPDGDMYWISFWNTPEGGQWWFINGTGKFEGVSGGGTSTPLAMGADGRVLIRWEGTRTLP